MERKRLSQKSDPARKVRAMLTHIGLLIQPIAIAATVSILWYIVHGKMPHFPHKDRETVAMILIVVLVVPFAVKAAEVFGTVINRHDRTIDCIWIEDKAVGRREFLKLRERRVSNAVHLLLGVLATMIVCVVSMFDFSEGWVGFSLVFFITFGFAVYWEVIQYLEDTSQSEWFRLRVPTEWYEADIDKEFGFVQLSDEPEMPVDLADAFCNLPFLGARD